MLKNLFHGIRKPNSITTETEEYEYVKALSNREGEGQVHLGHRDGGSKYDPQKQAIAFKVYHQHLSGESVGHEVDILKGCNHRHVVKHYAVEEVSIGGAPASPAVAMEWIDGASLEKKIGKGILRPEQVAAVMAQVSLGCRDVQAATGYIHNDIKPANILMDKSGQIKVADFGIMQKEGTPQTDRNNVGSDAYRAPETIPSNFNPRYVNCPKVDERRDVYSIGLVGYELATGHHARVFQHDDNHFARHTKIVKEESPRTVQSDPVLGRAISHATEADPLKRSTHLDLLADLSTFKSVRNVLNEDDRKSVANHVIERARNRPERDPMLDQRAAIGLLEDWKGEASVRRQLEVIAENRIATKEQGEATRPNARIVTATEFHGHVIGVPAEKWSTISPDQAEQRAHKLQKSIDSEALQPDHRELIREVRSNVPHLNGVKTERILGLLVEDFRNIARAKDSKSNETYAELINENGSRGYGFVTHANEKAQMQGTWHFFQSGERIAQSSFQDHRLHGTSIEYDSQGKPWRTAQFAQGEKNGKETIILNDRIVESKTWSQGKANTHESGPSPQSNPSHGPTR